MHAGFEFTRQKMIDGAMPVDAALTSKAFRNQFDAKVGCARVPGGAVPCHGVGVAACLWDSSMTSMEDGVKASCNIAFIRSPTDMSLCSRIS